jgi:hypothetical protein
MLKQIWAEIHKISYKVFTKLLQSSYKVLTKFLQSSYKVLTKFLQSSYKVLTKFLQSSYKVLTSSFRADPDKLVQGGQLYRSLPSVRVPLGKLMNFFAYKNCQWKTLCLIWSQHQWERKKSCNIDIRSNFHLLNISLIC